MTLVFDFVICIGWGTLVIVQLEDFWSVGRCMVLNAEGVIGSQWSIILGAKRQDYAIKWKARFA